MTTTPPHFSSTQDEAEQLSKWPKKLGYTAVGFGIASVLAGICGSVGALFAGVMGNMAAKYQPAGDTSGSAAASIEVMTKFQGLLIANGVLAVLLASLLIFAGVRLASRRANSRQLIQVWAALKILLAVGAAFLGYMVQKATIAAMPAESAATPASSGAGMQFMQTMQTVGLVLTFVWACALALFMLIWFSRATIKSEVASWE